MSAEIRASYEELLGHVPETVEHRIALVTEVGHPASVDAIEAFRVELLHRNQLDPRTQQLVHFALLIGAGHEGPASIHARGALHNGATNTDLYGVCTFLKAAQVLRPARSEFLLWKTSSSSVRWSCCCNRFMNRTSWTVPTVFDLADLHTMR